MRISGGSAKGRRTATKGLLSRSSQGERLRPTSAKVREALFDIIANRIQGATFVDLYAGTGTVGFESLSRGAARAYFVEPDPAMIKNIRERAGEFGFTEKSEIFQGRADEFLNKALQCRKQFDIFFLDPPYHSVEIEIILPIIGHRDLLREDGVVVVEHFFKKKPPEQVARLTLQKSYRYGDTMLTLYRRGK